MRPRRNHCIVLKRKAIHISRRSAVLLLGLVLFQGIGWLLAWQILQWEAGYTARERLNRQETDLRTIRVSKDFFQQNRIGEREIRLNGELFDIRSIENLSDTLSMTLYHDQAEEALFDALGSRLNRPSDAASQPLTNWLLDSFSLVFIIPAGPVLPESVPGKTAFTWHFGFDSIAPAPLFIPPRTV